MVRRKDTEQNRKGEAEGVRGAPYQEVVKFNKCRIQSVHGNLLLLTSVLDFADARWL
jgi:hypothetical protein